jgi:hypothetical protein
MGMIMSISLSLTPAAEKVLAARAAQEGKTLQGYIQEMVEKEASTETDSEIARTACTPEQIAGQAQAEKEIVDEDDDARPWRGVFTPVRERKTLFTTELQFRLADLPKREPHVTISPRWIDDDE